MVIFETPIFWNLTFLFLIVIAHVKASMSQRGAGTIRGLGRIFNTTGECGNRRIGA